MKKFAAALLGVALTGMLSLPAHAGQKIPCPVFAPNTPSGPTLSTLAPSSPTAARLCHYAAGNEKLLVGNLVFSKPVAKPVQLARLLNQAKLIRTGTLHDCLANFRGQTTVLFRTRSGMETTVSVETSGCQDAISNHTSGGWLLSKSARAALRQLDPAFR